jgi:hypothetical protein
MNPRATLLCNQADIAWALEVHAKTLKGPYGLAMLYGNEDAPERIDFWNEEMPKHDTPPAAIWHPTQKED